MSTPLTPSADRPGVPAAQLLGRVEWHLHGDLVRLPERFARAALLRHLATVRGGGQVICGEDTDGPAYGLAADQWAIRVRADAVAPLALALLAGSVRRLGPELLIVSPRNTVLMHPGRGKRLLLALEDVKPEELDPAGRPSPWVPAVARAAVEVYDDGEAEDDARPLGPGEPLPALRPAPARGTESPFISDDTIRGWFSALCGSAGFSPALELTLTRGAVNRLGFVTGRVWFRVGGAPLRVHLTTCPNSDGAEILATITHELAHPLAHADTGSRAHDLAMKRAMVELAERQWGGAYFTAARGRLDAPVRSVDYWLATGIRAALRGADAPAAKTTDDGQLARVLGKLKKLRALAQNQQGRPEGIAATGAANDLVTLYDLGSYGVGVGEVDDDQMVDRWVVLEDGAVWRRLLAHGVAAHFGVFALAVTATGRMHFFGTHADVVAAEYLYSVSAARIGRESQDHMRAWKKARASTSAAESRVEKTSFCDCAVIEFRKKLKRIADEDSDDGDAPLVAAEQFARAEHEKRGRSWGSGSKKRYRENAAGRAVGAAMEVLHGVGGERGKAPLGLGRKG